VDMSARSYNSMFNASYASTTNHAIHDSKALIHLVNDVKQVKTITYNKKKT
jgi:hypothetical protein